MLKCSRLMYIYHKIVTVWATGTVHLACLMLTDCLKWHMYSIANIICLYCRLPLLFNTWIWFEHIKQYCGFLASINFAISLLLVMTVIGRRFRHSPLSDVGLDTAHHRHSVYRVCQKRSRTRDTNNLSCDWSIRNGRYVVTRCSSYERC